MNMPRVLTRNPWLRRIPRLAAYTLTGVAALLLLVHASQDAAPLTTVTVLAGAIVLALGLPMEMTA